MKGFNGEFFVGVSQSFFLNKNKETEMIIHKLGLVIHTPCLFKSLALEIDIFYN